MEFYIFKSLKEQQLDICQMDGDSTNTDVNDPKTWFWIIGTDEPIKRSEIEILAGPFSIEQLIEKLLPLSKK